MASVAKNTIYYGVGSLMRAIASFILLPVYANILGTSQYGTLNLLQTFSAIVAPIMTLSVEKSIYRLYFDYKTEKEKRKFLSTIFWSINIFGIIVVFICAIWGNQITNYIGGVDVIAVLYPVTIYTFFSALITCCQIILQTQQKGNVYFLISMLILICYNAIALYLLYNWSPTYESEIYANLITLVLVFPVAFYFVHKQIGLCFNYKILKKIISFAMPLFVMSMFSWLLSASDRFFIANYQNTSDVGLYSMAFKLVSMGVLFAASMKQAFDPYFFNLSNTKDEITAKDHIKPVMDTMVFLTSMLFIMVILFGKIFIGMFLRCEFQACIIYLYFLVLSSVFTQYSVIINVMILQCKKTTVLSLIIITSGLISVLLNAYLIPKYGSIMAAVNSMLVGVYMFVVTWLFSKKSYYIVLKFGNMWATIIIVIVCSIIDSCLINIYLGVAIKLVIIITGLLFFFKIKVISCPILWELVRRGKNLISHN